MTTLKRANANIILELILIPLFVNCGYLDLNRKFYGRSPAEEGIVTVYNFSGGENGEIIAETDLINGNFEFSANIKSEIILIEIKNFSYMYKIYGRKISSGDNFRWEALVTNPQAENEYNVNPLTTIASALSKFQIGLKTPKSKNDLITLVNHNNTEIGNHFGGIEIIQTIPSALDYPSMQLTSEIKYGLILSAFEELSWRLSESPINFSVSPYNLINLTESIYDDLLFDGFLDGNSGYGSSSLEAGAPNDQLLKSSLAMSIYRIVENRSINKTGLTYSETDDFLNSISTSRAAIFRNESLIFPFDANPPIINCSKPQNGEIISGEIEIRCEIGDQVPGVAKTTVDINGSIVQNSLATPLSFYAVVEKSSLGSNQATIRVKACDLLGNESSYFINLLLTAN